MVRVVWATQSRSGSQFLLQLTLKLMGQRAWPQARISGSRQDGLGADRVPSFFEMAAESRAIEYLERNDIVAVKLEDPGIDGLATELARAFPASRWLTSLRPLDAILLSHHNIEKWGHDEEYVLSSFRGGIELLESLADERRLFVVKVDEPSSFDTTRFAAFLGYEPTSAFLEVAREWRPINDLRYQKDKWGEEFAGEAIVPDSLGTLRDRHPWVHDIEARYEEVWRRCH